MANMIETKKRKRMWNRDTLPSGFDAQNLMKYWKEKGEEEQKVGGGAEGWST